MNRQTLSLTMVTGPTAEPITLAEARKQVELPSDDSIHTDHLTDLIAAARDQLELDTDAAIMVQTWKQAFDQFEHTMMLAKRPLRSVTSITYYDDGGTQQTLASSIYDVDTTRNEVSLALDQSWPSFDGRLNGIEVTYSVGYATTADEVPPFAKQAMRFLIGWYFNNRDMMNNDLIYTQRPYEDAIKRMLRTSYP